MGRFDYLTEGQKAGKRRKVTPEPDGRRTQAAGEPLEPVYLRRETVRAVWKQVKKDGGESVSELVEDLLLAWLRARK
ncbi:hypothetical protein [Deinococcus multiflagellatus]|uniref:CopG family transcriptional regulator n=1 Tax=Deinococcus multiflagellatus TaxID=1656887 RepID=A0ABW1ZH19_9DEIO|nr:hypothetical protein [Deinococcus multiflagellatus]MBZ9711983.1 hypothetical protein [Deinococcus multiflagellatus]